MIGNNEKFGLIISDTELTMTSALLIEAVQERPRRELRRLQCTKFRIHLRDRTENGRTFK